MAILPNTYKRVEYIESSGTQYIDTNYIPTNNTKVELKMGWWTWFGSYPNLFWARLEWSTTWKWFQLWKTTTWSWDYFAMFGGYLTWLSPSTFSFGDGSDHVIEMSQSWIYEDGSLKQSLSSATFTSPTNMVIFADNENWTVSENGAYKLYYFKLYESWTLVRDFLPCYRISDGVIWLYDLVNDVFYTNQWTWTFTKWPDVPTHWKIQRIYVGQNIARPSTIEKSFNFANGSGWSENLYLSGCKISKIVLTWNVTRSSTWADMEFWVGGNSRFVHLRIPLWRNADYSGNSWGWFAYNDGSEHRVYNFPANRFSSNWGNTEWEITPDYTKVTQGNTYTYTPWDATFFNYISIILSSNSISTYSWGTASWLSNWLDVKVTYST